MGGSPPFGDASVRVIRILMSLLLVSGRRSWTAVAQSRFHAGFRSECMHRPRHKRGRPGGDSYAARSAPTAAAVVKSALVSSLGASSSRRGSSSPVVGSSGRGCRRGADGLAVTAYEYQDPAELKNGSETGHPWQTGTTPLPVSTRWRPRGGRRVRRGELVTSRPMMPFGEFLPSVRARRQPTAVRPSDRSDLPRRGKSWPRDRGATGTTRPLQPDPPW
jgi:hypothetical protein